MNSFCAIRNMHTHLFPNKTKHTMDPGVHLLMEVINKRFELKVPKIA